MQTRTGLHLPGVPSLHKGRCLHYVSCVSPELPPGGPLRVQGCL